MEEVSLVVFGFLCRFFTSVATSHTGKLTCTKVLTGSLILAIQSGASISICHQLAESAIMFFSRSHSSTWRTMISAYRGIRRIDLNEMGFGFVASNAAKWLPQKSKRPSIARTGHSSFLGGRCSYFSPQMRSVARTNCWSVTGVSVSQRKPICAPKRVCELWFFGAGE